MCMDYRTSKKSQALLVEKVDGESTVYVYIFALEYAYFKPHSTKPKLASSLLFIHYHSIYM